MVSPFLVPNPDTITHSGWKIATPDGVQTLPADLPAWDYLTVLDLTTEIEIDVDAVLTSCELSHNTSLALAVRATSDTTSVRQIAASTPVRSRGSQLVPLNVRLPGHEFSGRLALETILLAVKPDPLGAAAADHPGSVLWSNRVLTRLQGSGPQFPTDAADFRAIGRPSPIAAWELQVDLADPEASFMSAVRLTLNTGRPAVVRLLEGAKDESTQQLRRTMHWDVTRQLIQYAIDCDEAMNSDFDPEATSVAGVLRNVVSLVWPTTSTSTVKFWAQHDPARIETEIQQHCRLVL